jgi:hypothetical protein
MVDTVQVPGNMSSQEQVHFADQLANGQYAVRVSNDLEANPRAEYLAIDAELQ